ncbi:hypothetical protein POM88_051282 [Heracleum sosnowskyi]|uniref:Uncharacterized protein n=1 Tax=Heracleum sosnowskyi TaxID=360622 RepID=A0AAD8H078_9APIA|nr:hypothetical protein POM88_051282 [Heracleum sosnowskyi]
MNVVGATASRASSRGDRTGATKLHAESFRIEDNNHHLNRNNNIKNHDVQLSTRDVDLDLDRQRDPIINVDDDSTQHKLSVTTKSVLSPADLLKTLFFVLVWYTFSLLVSATPTTVLVVSTVEVVAEEVVSGLDCNRIWLRM